MAIIPMKLQMIVILNMIVIDYDMINLRPWPCSCYISTESKIGYDFFTRNTQNTYVQRAHTHSCILHWQSTDTVYFVHAYLQSPNLAHNSGRSGPSVCPDHLVTVPPHSNLNPIRMASATPSMGCRNCILVPEILQLFIVWHNDQSDALLK